MKSLSMLSLVFPLIASANDYRCEGKMDSSMCEIICRGEVINFSIANAKQIESRMPFELEGGVDDFSAYGAKIHAERGNYTEVTIETPTSEQSISASDITTHSDGLNYESMPKAGAGGLSTGLGIWLACRSKYQFLNE